MKLGKRIPDFYLRFCRELLLIGEKGKLALASGEEANNREKAREVYCPQDHYSIEKSTQKQLAK